MKDLELMSKTELEFMQEKIARLLNNNNNDKISNMIECVAKEKEMENRHSQERDLLKAEMKYLPLLKELDYITCPHPDEIFIYGDRDENGNFKEVRLMLETRTLVAKQSELPAPEKITKIEAYFGKKITILGE